MTNEDLFDAWAPADAVWSPWAKPALFAQSPTFASVPESQPAPADAGWIPGASGQRALVVELPGVRAAALAVPLAAKGHRPVPLFNTCDDPSAVIDVRPLVSELAAAAAPLRGRSLPPDAPPAFLLDSNRLRPAVLPEPGKFDNRWVVFPQDFPSAAFLQSRGIREVLLIMEGETPQQDLAHVLRRWQDAGIAIHAMPPAAAPPRSIVVEKPSWFRMLGYRLIARSGLRRNNAGGFGAVIPVITSGGGYG